MVYKGLILLFLIRVTFAVRINFTSCQQTGWICANNIPSDIVYNCANVGASEFIVHLKDFYTDHLLSLTIQNCKDLKVIIDCPVLQRPSKLQSFKIKNCDRLEFSTLTSNSAIQTPSEIILENVKGIVNIPRKFFKSPTNTLESKCLGTTALKKIRIANSNIFSINTKAIYNVSGARNIEFDNVTITNVQTQAIEVIAGDYVAFVMNNCTIDNLESKGLTIQSRNTIISNNVFNDIVANSINVTSEILNINKNNFKEIRANGLMLIAAKTDFTDNYIKVLKSNALTNVKCLRRRMNKKHFKFIKNRIENVEPYALNFDYQSCKSIGAAVMFQDNKIDCKCRNIAYLSTSRNELHGIILNVSNSNTCISAPCSLPVEVVKLLLESAMCQINLDSQVMCLLYNDRHTTNYDITTDEDVTEPAPTFYLIRQANAPKGDASAAMTAIDKDNLLKDSHLNMTNRTTIKVVFDSSRDFVETLRSTKTNHNKPEVQKPQAKDEYESHCTGSHCRDTVAYNKQKALEFYKYVYAQLRPPKQIDKKKKT